MVINCKKEKIMKRIYSFVFAAIAILSAASCQKEIVAPEADSNATAFSFVAERDTETKTTLVNGKSTYWTPGDKVSAFDSNGTAVTFATAITENSASALFACESFSIPGNGPIHAVYPAKPDAKLGADGVIGILRVAGTQKAVAGSFDPEYAVAYAKGQVTDLTTPPALQFTNIHSLVKFTIGGDKAPGTVVLTNGGARNIAGQFSYNTNNGQIIQNPDMGAKTITLTPATGDSFKVGETYYIAVIGGGNFANITLTFDETVVKTVSGAKYANETNNFLLNKIIDFGTVQFPSEEPEPEPANFTATAVMSKQSEGSTSYMTTFGGTANADRNIGMDDEYVYIAETQANPVLWKISIADGTASKMPVGTVNGGGTFALACPRIIPNTDPTINNGEDVLTVSNMGMDGGNTFLYVYNNGIKADPTKLDLNTAWMGRRIGDKFTFMSGTNGLTTLWMKDGNSGALLSFNLTMKDRAVSCTEATSRTYLLENWVAGVGAIYFYPGATSSVEGMYTSTGKGTYVVRTDNVLTADNKPTYVAQWEDLTTFKGCHGFNFFKVGDRNYIAYTKYSDQTLYIINGTANAAGVKAALEANDVVWSAKIAADGNGCYSGNSGADCAVRTLDDGSVLVAGHIQNVGVVVFKLTLNN